MKDLYTQFAHNYLSLPKKGIDYFFTPKHIALIGASEKEGSVGKTLAENLLKSVKTIEISFINPNRPSVFSHPCHKNLASLTSAPDLVVIATPAKSVPSVVKECKQIGVKAIVIISAGFREVGEEGVALEREILSVIENTDIRIIGPNCLGIMNPHIGLNATFSSQFPKQGQIAFISQSGAMCTSVLDWSLKNNVGFSAFISIGAMMDVSWGDLIEYLGSDPNTSSILLYMESIGNARAFISATRHVAWTKPIIIIKPGKTQAAAEAAASHTGSLAGSDDAFQAAISRAGALRVNRISQLFDMANILAKQPMPKGPNLTIVTNAGGPAVLATDETIISGAKITKLSDSTIQNLSTFLPSAWSHANPVDILGDAKPDTYKKAVETLLTDDDTDGILVILTPQDMTDPSVTAEKLVHLSSEDKPIITSWMGGENIEKGAEILSQNNMPCFDYPDEAAHVFSLMYKHFEDLKALYQVSELSTKLKRSSKTQELFEKLRKESRELLTEYESKWLIEEYGIPTVKTLLATDIQSAVEAAQTIGFPVALKLHSTTITHKTDVGGVKLNLENTDQVVQAFKQIETSVTKLHGKAHFQGVSIQQMIIAKGVELILGSYSDPQIGPIMLFGAGGQNVEIFKDRALALPPINNTLAMQMIEKTKIHKALTGFRGAKPVDLKKLTHIIVAFSQMLAFEEEIKECDINPLLASDGSIIALDARVILHKQKQDIVPLAIRPYPCEYVISCRLKSNETITIRPIRPEDIEKMMRFHEELSTTSVKKSYFQFLEESKRTSHDRIVQICYLDYDRDLRFVAEDSSGSIVGVAALIRTKGPKEGIFHLLIVDRLQGQGLGSNMMKHLIETAQKERFSDIYGVVLQENPALIALCKKFNFSISKEEGKIQVHKTLN